MNIILIINNSKNNIYNNKKSPDLIIINKKVRICKFFDFTVPTNHRIKLKDCEKKHKYLDLARELKKTVVHKGDD